MNQDKDITALWEQMGASTGTFLGSLIGYTARSSLQAYEQMVLNPLKQLNHAAGAANSTATSSGQSPPGVREETWQKMGRQFGENIGISIGMSMDLLIDTLEKSSASVLPGYTAPAKTNNAEPQSSQTGNAAPNSNS